MIHIIKKYCDMTEHYEVESVWEVDCEDIDTDYKNYILKSAKQEFNIVVNPHWLNIMNKEDHHPNLTMEEYVNKVKLWNRFIELHPKEWYIKEELKGKRLEFKTVYSK